MISAIVLAQVQSILAEFLGDRVINLSEAYGAPNNALCPLFVSPAPCSKDGTASLRQHRFVEGGTGLQADGWGYRRTERCCFRV
jgi:hypothetical protein